MHVQRNDRRRLISVIVAAVAAVVGQAAVLLNDFGGGNASDGGVNARIITAAVVSRAGAIEIPSEQQRPGGAGITRW
jgi:hypothetical protein